jgi:hypothetical protein
MTSLVLSEFCLQCKLVDDRLKLANIDLLGVSANNQKIGTIKNKSGLIRSEFFEFLVRLAKFKYFETDMFPTIHESLTYVIEEFIKPNYVLTEW